MSQYLNHTFVGNEDGECVSVEGGAPCGYPEDEHVPSPATIENCSTQ